MNCGKARRLIITNYIDGEADAASKAAVKKHLEACVRCARFEEAVLRAAVRPFENAGKKEVPARMWSRIKDRLGEQRPAPAPLNPIREIARGMLSGKPALALAAAAVIAVFTLFVSRPSLEEGNKVNAYLAEQLRFMSGEDYYGVNGYAETGYYDLGTGIEKYFL